MIKKLFLGLCTCFVCAALSAQDFGFGFDSSGSDDESKSGNLKPKAVFGGEVSASLAGYFDDFKGGFAATKLGDVFTGKLDFSAHNSFADGIINLKFSPVFDGSVSPVTIDEAYLAAFFRNFSLEGGLRKLTWGRADSFGPLDIINPIDYSDLSIMGKVADMKIARPLIHGSFKFGSFTKLEAVFIPTFKGHNFAYSKTNRWMPSQFTNVSSSFSGTILRNPDLAQAFMLAPNGPAVIEQGMNDRMDQFIDYIPEAEKIFTSLKYAQAGLRFTTTMKSADFGVQYFYGNMFRPSIGVAMIDDFQKSLKYAAMAAASTGEFDENLVRDAFDKLQFDMLYNRYHHAGIDYAQVIAGFNIRVEAAAIITNDLSGDKGDVYNPQIAWSVGFDRDLFWGINLNLQANENVRLLHSKTGTDQFFDIENGTDITSTRITAVLSKKFLRDEFEIKASGLWGIEDKDFLILPSITWTKNDVTVELAGGIFGGSKDGELGQYKDNDFIKAAVRYRF
ncbi:MAG: hypothetical protein Ta2F_04570 [Termitinemataceae bacterium]|nr:MAG: hypothetical protein Ta2F_04570 [Termitinemataceae bacterium]